MERSTAAACLCVFAGCAVNVAGSLIGAAVLPHGDFAFDPKQLHGVGSAEDVAKAEMLHAGSMEAASFIAALQADLILLTTPHGLQSSWDWSFYGNSHLKGSALVGRDAEESFGGGRSLENYTVHLDVLGVPEVASALVDELSALGSNASLVKGWNDVLPEELHWGEVLPLELLRRAGKGNLPPILAVGLPLSRYNFSSAVAQGVLQMGRRLGHALTRGGMNRIAVVVSTDLAHRHWSNTTFGFSPDAAPFDASMGQWAATLDETALLGDHVLKIVDHIYACGYLGMVLLQGALQGSGGRWQSKVTAAPVAPTYYGMMAATFEPAGLQFHV